MRKRSDKAFEKDLAVEDLSSVLIVRPGSKEDQLEDENEDGVWQRVKIAWLLIVSITLWTNLFTTPLVMMWPEMQIEIFYTPLWIVEIVYVINIARKLLFNQKNTITRKQDAFEAAVDYIKSTLIFDVLSTLPQVASAMNPQFTPFKIIRIYELDLLHYPFEQMICICYQAKDKTYIKSRIYASMTVSRILILLHYLAVIWIFIGSDYFVGYEDGYTPWTLENEDFKDYSDFQLLIFSIYWVCTVITTVGYGDYSGGTTVEY